jgi:hypothetical protein
MTDRAQFEAMLEALINDDQQAAKEIFHNIVVGKSREIYEELLAEDFSRDTGNPYGQSESKDEEEDSMEEDMDEEGEMESADESDDSDDSEEEPEDDADDSEEEPEDDGEEDPFAGDEEGDEADGDIEDRVMDLEDALEDLKAEFEQLLAGEEGEEHMGGHDMGADDMGAMGGDDMGMDAEVDELAPMMEYVNKVPAPKHGDNGNNTKSIVAGKNDMGGTTANIAQGYVEVHGDAGTKAGGTAGGLAKNKPGDLTAGLGEIHNRPGKTDANKKGFKKQVAGGGIDRQAGFNKPGKQVGATDSSGKGESNTQSTLRARK